MRFALGTLVALRLMPLPADLRAAIGTASVARAAAVSASGAQLVARGSIPAPDLHEASESLESANA